MVNHAGMRLGKLPPRPEPRLKTLGAYLKGPRPAVPASIDRAACVAAWPMLYNDAVGDCTIAAVGHAVQLWTAVARHEERTMSAAEALAAYSAISGYVAGEPDTDHGAVAVDVLERWVAGGFTIAAATDQLAGFCAIALARPDEVRAAVAWLGVCYSGLELPIAVQTEDVWDVSPVAGSSGESSDDWAPGSWGGHCVPIVGYDPDGLVCITWGQTKRLTWRFWNAYASEAYGLLSRDFAGDAVDWARLQTDMALLRSEVA